MGTGADGRFRRLEVGLCIMWPAIAVTVSLLSLPPRGSGTPPLLLSTETSSLPHFAFPRIVPVWRNRGIRCVKGDSVVFFLLLLFTVHVKKPSFFIFLSSLNHLGFDFKTCCSHNPINRLSADLIDLGDVYFFDVAAKFKQAKSPRDDEIFYIFFPLVRKCFFLHIAGGKTERVTETQ